MILHTGISYKAHACAQELEEGGGRGKREGMGIREVLVRARICEDINAEASPRTREASSSCDPSEVLSGRFVRRRADRNRFRLRLSRLRLSFSLFRVEFNTT